MPKTGIRLFRLFGIDVYLHWAWIIVALIELRNRNKAYRSNVWNVIEYLSLFVIVLMHEFGHALACRSVGGQADRILLWPLGGVAYVSPPQRSGAVLWSIAAGPLVNVLLLPVTIGLYLSARHAGWATHDVRHYLFALAFINAMLLAFNLMPAYPLDGGQILRALLWFLIGPVTSLRVACVIGLFGAAGVIALAVWLGGDGIYLGVMGGFMLLQSWAGLKRAKAMVLAREAPRHPGFACPSCGEPPPAGPYWRCPCGNLFDTFAHDGACPNCGRRFEITSCPRCGQNSPRPMWRPPNLPALPAIGYAPFPGPVAPNYGPTVGGGIWPLPPPPPAPDHGSAPARE